jgi:hypothetical protein
MRHLLPGSADRLSYGFRIMAAAIVACGVVAGGLVLATIPDSNGVIHGCYLKSGGTVRVIDSSVTNCKAGETAISWSVQGPPGLPGAPGAPGEPGQRGPSDAFLVDQRSSFASHLLDNLTFTDLVTLSLPAGSYVVNGTAALASGATFAGAQCFIRNPGSTPAFPPFDVQGTIGGSANSFLTLTLTGAFTLSAPADVSLSCRGASSIATQPSVMTAIQVETLTDQS